jgi:hypothetical protein
MPALANFLERLLHDGQAILRARPIATPKDTVAALRVLREAYATYSLTIAGPAPAFDADTALAAGECVRQASWFLLHRGDPYEDLEKDVVLAGSPTTPSTHLSADLSLRFLPGIFQRAKSLYPDDPLPVRLADILRRWPLSGVLADLPEGPSEPLNLGGHKGLMLLCAERLARHEKPAWLPAGEALAHVELVYHYLGRDLKQLRTVEIKHAENDDE